MKTVNIHEAKTNLSRLIAEVESGGSFIIAKAGKPMAKVVPYDQAKPKRYGFMEGQGKVPDDFNTMFQKEIAEMFYGGLQDDQAPIKGQRK